MVMLTAIMIALSIDMNVPTAHHCHNSKPRGYFSNDDAFRPYDLARLTHKKTFILCPTKLKTVLCPALAQFRFE